MFNKLFKKQNSKNIKTSEERKQENIIFLKSKNIKTLESLPHIEAYEDIQIREKKEIVDRALGLVLIALYAESLMSSEGDIEESRNFVNKVMAIYEAYDVFSPKEKTFFESNSPSQAEVINFSWQYEPYVVMLWALGFYSAEEALGVPAEICDVPKAAKTLNQFRSYKEFFGASEVLDKELIVDQADLIYRYNWVSVDERINNVTGNELVWSITMERHKALNWLISYGHDDWDDVGTDT